MTSQTEPVQLGPATVEVPATLQAGAEQVEVAGDSPVSAWQGDGIRLQLDRGPFADPLTGYGRRAGFGSSSERVAGRPGRLVWFDRGGGGRVVAVHVPGATLLVEADAEVPLDALLAIARSLSLP